jgi:plasmid stability protein
MTKTFNPRKDVDWLAGATLATSARAEPPRTPKHAALWLQLTSCMARPRQGEVRDQRVNFRLTLEEAVRLRARAARAGRSVSDYARAAALAGATSGRRERRRPLAMEPASYHQIRLLGVNLNQIARRLNAQDMPAPPELAPLLAEIQAALRKALADP